MKTKIGNYKLETLPMTTEALFEFVEETSVERAKAELREIAMVLPEDEVFTEAEALEWYGIDDWMFDDLFDNGFIGLDLPTCKYRRQI